MEVDEGVKGEEGDILGRVKEVRREVLVFNKLSGDEKQVSKDQEGVDAPPPLVKTVING